VDNNKIGIAILIGLGIFLFFLTKKLPAPALTSGCASYEPLKLMPAGSLSSGSGMLHYKNRETRNIEWSDEGLPSKIVIEREYYRLP